MVNIDQFFNIEMKVGEILSAEKLEDADKLLVFSIDLGEAEPRKILSGIAMHYSPEELVGKKCVVVANLEPRTIRGEESNGMLVCVSYTDESGAEVVKLVFPDQTAPVGSKLS